MTPLLIRRESGPLDPVLARLVGMREEAMQTITAEDFPCGEVKRSLLKYITAFALQLLFLSSL